jgi:ATP-dependent DNA ligase
MRCLAVVTCGRARLQSRQQRPLTRYFPEIVAALGEHFDDVVLDGVIWGRRRRVHHVADT